METVLIVIGALIGVLVALALVLAVIGAFLPKAHTASRAVDYRAAPDTVWAAITDWPHHPSWRPKLKGIERLPDRNGHPVWKEVRGRGDTLTSEGIESDPTARRMITRIVDERAFGGTWTWQVLPAANGGSSLRITEDGEVYNPIFRVVSAWFMDRRSTMDTLHRDLKAKLAEPPPVLPD